MTRAGDVEVATQQEVERFGRPDFALNNAGIEQLFMPLIEIEDEECARPIAINLGGLFFCIKQEVPGMLKQGGDPIVNFSSRAGVKGFA